MTRGIAVFSYAAWSARYPNLVATTPEGLANELFSEATLYLDNSLNSVVQDVNKRTMLLNMLVAHLSILNAGTGASPGMVGRIKSATKGSVTVSSEAAGTPGTSAWFTQTQPGISYWQATAPYRTARYVAGYPQRPRYIP